MENKYRPSPTPPVTIAEPLKDTVVGSDISLAKLEEMHIKALLNTDKSLGEIAKILGIDQATLYRKRKELSVLTRRNARPPV